MRTAFVVAVTITGSARIVEVKISCKHDEAVLAWVIEGGDDALEDIFYCHGHDGHKIPGEAGIYLLTAHVSITGDEGEIIQPRWSPHEI